MQSKQQSRVTKQPSQTQTAKQAAEQTQQTSQLQELKTTELDIIKQLFESLNESDKEAFINGLTTKQNSKQEISAKLISQHKIKACPHCESTHFVRNGTCKTAQRYLCRHCRKTFTDTNKTILFSTKKSMEVWQKYVHCLVEKYSLRKTAKICGIGVNTAFFWRHKILDALQNMQDEVKLNGIVEADETFLPLSFKGQHKNFQLPRLAKHRGTRAVRRGLSNEQVCIPCLVNHNGLSVAKSSNLGKPKLTDLQKVIANKVAKDSVFVTDSLRAYLKISADMELNHIRIPRKRHKVGAFSIQTINSYHSRLKAMIIHTFKGVSTKHLNNYLVYHNFVNFAKDSIDDKKSILLDFIQRTECVSKVSGISSREIMVA